MGKKDTIKISTASSSILCTLDHKILTEYGYVDAQDINIGDCIAYRIGSSSNKTYSINKLKIIGYLLGDGILNGKNNICHTIEKYYRILIFIQSVGHFYVTSIHISCSQCTIIHL